MRKKQFLDTLVRSRYKPKRDLDNLLQRYERENVNRRPQVIKGVHRGQYFRVKLPPRQPVNILPDVPKLTNPTGLVPKALTGIPPKQDHNVAASVGSGAHTGSMSMASRKQQRQEDIRDFFDRLHQWWNENWSVLLMNFGSFCTLAAFTRYVLNFKVEFLLTP